MRNSVSALVARTKFLLIIDLLKKALSFSAFFYVFFSLNAYADIAVCPPQRIDESMHVEYVFDGDTVRLSDGRKVRMLGIDTPEVFSKKKTLSSEAKASGIKAREALRKILETQEMKVSLAYGQQRFDHYGRTLAHLFTVDGINIQAKLLSQGYAVAFTTPPNDRQSDCYQQQEKQARQAKLGIWLLPQYQLKYADKLQHASLGFQRIQGTVTRIKKTQSRITLTLDDKLDVMIYKKDWSNFSLHMLSQLQDKKVRVRGWLRKYNTHYQLNLRHTDALTEDLAAN